MSVAGRTIGGVVAAAVLLAGGYLWADVHDFVPGYLTIAPAPAPPVPFPIIEVPTVNAELAAALPPIDTSKQRPTAAAVTKLVQEFARDQEVLGERVGVMVSDSLTGEVLAQVNAETRLVPASVQKVMAGAAAMAVLDTNRTLKTKVLSGPDGSIFLVGEGDMLLAAQAGNPDVINGRAGLLDLAQAAAAQLESAGIAQVQLYLDDSLFTGPDTGPWGLDMVTDGYAAPVATLAVDVGREQEGNYAPRFRDPAMQAAQQFAALLTQEGITVTEPTRKAFGQPGEGVSVVGDQVLAQVESAPLGEIVDYAMKISDNTLTEIIGHTIARELGFPASFDGAIKGILQTMGDLGLDTTGVSLVDASGLGDTSYVTARFINDLLNVMVSPEHPELREGAIGLAIAGMDGTLSNRFQDRNGRGLVRGKTGSLNNVTSLAGTVVTLDNRLLTFVVLTDETPGGQAGPRQAMDTLVEQLAECGCQ